MYYASTRHFAKNHLAIFTVFWPIFIIGKHVNDYIFEYNGIYMNSIIPIFYAIATRVPFRSILFFNCLHLLAIVLRYWAMYIRIEPRNRSTYCLSGVEFMGELLFVVLGICLSATHFCPNHP